MALSQVVMDIACCNEWDVESFRDVLQAIQSLAITLDEIVLDLDKDIVFAEELDETFGRSFGVCEMLAIEQARDFTLATAAQHNQAFGVSGEIFWIECRRAWIFGWPMGCFRFPRSRAFVSQGDESAQVGVAALRLGKECQMYWPFFFFYKPGC